MGGHHSSMRLCICRPGFESQANHLRFFSICMIEIIFDIGMRKARKETIKRLGLAQNSAAHAGNFPDMFHCGADPVAHLQCDQKKIAKCL